LSQVNFVFGRQLLELVPLEETIVLDLAVGFEVAEQGVDFVFDVVLRRSRSEVVLVNVDVAEQEETVRTVAATVVDQESVTTQLRRRDCVEFLGVDVVAVAGEQELEVEGRESSEAGFVERLRVDLRLGLGEEFVVVLPENRALRGDGFEAVAMQMVCELRMLVIRGMGLLVWSVALSSSSPRRTLENESRSKLVTSAILLHSVRLLSG
jgi:hypothetical protein